MRAARLLPGLLLCAAVGGAAAALHLAQARVLGRARLDSLVLAIVVGAAVRAVWRPEPPWARGVAFGATIPLEVAVVLLGASLDGRALSAFGAAALGGIAAVVVLGMAVGYGIGRLFGLDPRLALLVACGNAICGNSAIAAAPVIGADARQVAASVAFSAGRKAARTRAVAAGGRPRPSARGRPQQSIAVAIRRKILASNAAFPVRWTGPGPRHPGRTHPPSRDPERSWRPFLGPS